MATVALSGIITPSNVVTASSTTTLTNKTLTAPTIASANLTTALTLAGAAGTNGQVLTSAGSGLPSWTTPSSGLAAATQAEMEAASSNTVAATPLNTNWHPGVAKALLVCNSAGTIQMSLNITSITDGGVGILLVTLATAFSSVNYVINATGARNSGSATINVDTSNGQTPAGSFYLDCFDGATPSRVDPAFWRVACFGDQA